MENYKWPTFTVCVHCKIQQQQQPQQQQQHVGPVEEQGPLVRDGANDGQGRGGPTGEGQHQTEEGNTNCEFY